MNEDEIESILYIGREVSGQPGIIYQVAIGLITPAVQYTRSRL